MTSTVATLSTWAKRSHSSMSLVSFATVARSEAQAELDRKAHVCDSAFLAERGCLSRAESMRRPAPNHPA